jgi:hypothetical protein
VGQKCPQKAPVGPPVGDNARFDADFAVPVGHSWHPLVDILSPESHGVSFALLPNNIEVGVVADGRQVPFSRWLIQCRNARQVDMEDIATAVGRSVSFRPSIVLSVTSGCFTQQARHYVIRAMQLTNLQVFLVDAHDLRAIAADEATIKSILSRGAEQAKSFREQVTPFYA